MWEKGQAPWASIYFLSPKNIPFVVMRAEVKGRRHILEEFCVNSDEHIILEQTAWVQVLTTT